MKGFMLLLTQNLDSIVKNMNRLVEDFLGSHYKLEQEIHQKSIFILRKSSLTKMIGLDDLIDQLINIEGHLTIFDGGYLKEYFSKDELRDRETSVGTTNYDGEITQNQ